MKEFFGEELLLGSETAKKLYSLVKDLPIIDYHCHLDQNKIAADAGFSDIGELWLAGDHYKWRAMRLCGVDEEYITGGASYKEKFLKYAEIVPKLAGNALYYWTHMELKQVFGINEPLNKESAERIYRQATAVLKTTTVSTLLSRYKVEYVATTDDPIDNLKAHGRYQNTQVSPTFRPDKVFALSNEYLSALSKAAGTEISSLKGLLTALENRLDYFVQKGCKISDHGFERFPKAYATEAEAAEIFARRGSLNEEEKEKFFGFLLVWFAKEYAKRKMIMQLHFAVIRNNNPEMFTRCGADAGFDLIGEEQSVKDLVRFFAQLPDAERPETVIYTLNDGNLPSIIAATGAFRKVRAGAAWWFNDTVEGIRKNLKTVAEYSVLGTSFGMLTDSRSFSSYARFDFFRRILCGYLGDLVEKGEYDFSGAETLAKDICYNNIRSAIYG
ncbi:MAG: glucuronate isomerase [Clostridia bacterium]|nr:glucuronate isomerase [Clostridia bacterium]